MESLIMGFALLLAMKDHSAFALSIGGAIAILCLLTAGMMKKRTGWILGTLLQVGLVAYGVVVPLMYFLGGLFAALWVIAYFLGRKGEAIRAQLIAEREQKPSI